MLDRRGSLSCARLGICVTSLLIISLFCAVGARADCGPASSDFKYFPTAGIAITNNGFRSGVPTYTVTVSSNAHLVYLEINYPITIVCGIYAVNDSGDAMNSFQATGNNANGWQWNQHSNDPNSLDVAGWTTNLKSTAIITPESGSVSKTFSYGNLQFTGKIPMLGLRITVEIPDGAPSPFGQGDTGYITTNPNPEPAGSFTLASALLFSVTGLMRYVRSKNQRHANK